MFQGRRMQVRLLRKVGSRAAPFDAICVSYVHFDGTNAIMPAAAAIDFAQLCEIVQMGCG